MRAPQACWEKTSHPTGGCVGMPKSRGVSARAPFVEGKGHPPVGFFRPLIGGAPRRRTQTRAGLSPPGRPRHPHLAGEVSLTLLDLDGADAGKGKRDGLSTGRGARRSRGLVAEGE